MSCTRMMLKEIPVQVHLREEGDDGGNISDKKLWYLDSSTSNHITEQHEAFSERDMSVVGSVKFGNSSHV